MKKLLHITPHLGGGAGKAISGIVTELSGFDNTIIMLENPDDKRYSDKCIESGVKVIITSDNEDIQLLIDSSDVIILNWWAHPLEVDLILKIDLSSVYTVLWSHINGLDYPFLTYDFLKCFDKVMFTSPCVFENKLWTQIQKEDIEAFSKIVYGTGKFFPEKYNYKTKFDSSKIKICYSGTLDYSKMNRNAAYIVRQISENYKNVEFHFYGKYTEDFKNEFIKSSGTAEIFFNGFTSDIENVLLSMDIFFYPLTSENYATTENALLEAMAVGVPVVVLNNPAERSIVDDGNTGYIAENIENFVDIIIKLCKSESLRKEISSNARKTIIEKYNFYDNLKRFCDSINSEDKNLEKYTFKTIINYDVFKAFCHFCGNKTESEIFEYCKNRDIFYSLSKSSVFHYCRYFPLNNRFTKLAMRLNQYKNGDV